MYKILNTIPLSLTWGILMGNNNSEGRKHIEGLVFVASMFIGAGIGLLFGRPDAGGAIGMGIGFLLMALLRYYGVKVRPEKSITLKSTIGSLMLGIVGILFVIGGISLFLNIRFLMRYISGLFVIALGIIFLILAFRILTYKA